MRFSKSELTSGMLYEYRQKVIENLIYKVDADVHADTYTVRENYDMYAEPEFTGKYLDLCMKMYRTYKNESALENAKKVVDSIVKNQRADGFLGCLPEGKETLNFGVWNQAFTVLGLVSYYKTTGDERALEAAEKSVTYTMDHFMEGKADILDALNGGTQHISILYFICLLYKATKKEKYKTYIQFIVDTIKDSDLNFFDFEDILELRTRKGIENLIILLGILEYADIFQDKEAILAVEKYWQQVADTQIRNTGNGTITEFWTENGGGCMLLGPDIKANETCVAVGWIQLSLALFYLKQDVKYLDQIDKSLYNHMLASIAEDGSDFAYYQPNYGKKIKTTEVGLYKCCRYRGFTLFSYMDEMLYYEDEQFLIPMLYTSGHYCSEDVDVAMETNYPFETNISLTVTARCNKILKLRVPKNYTVTQLIVNGNPQNYEMIEGFIAIELQEETPVQVKLSLQPELYVEQGKIEEQEYVAFTYGCVLLAAKEVDENASVQKDNFCLIAGKTNSDTRMSFSISGIPYCDYASADDYSVWMPVK